jgi:hypothetical protein
MSSFKAIQSYADHPNRKYDPIHYIYLLDEQFYLGTEFELSKIRLLSIDEDNLSNPYKDFALLEFIAGSTQQTESIEISLEDAASLVAYCQKTKYILDIKPRLLKHTEFLSLVRYNKEYQNKF